MTYAEETECYCVMLCDKEEMRRQAVYDASYKTHTQMTITRPHIFKVRFGLHALQK